MSSCLPRMVSQSGHASIEGDIRRSNSTTRYYKVVVLGHASGRLYYFILIVCYDFDSLQVDAQREAEFSKVRRIGVDGLLFPLRISRSILLWPVPMDKNQRAFPPSTSSPMIMQPAV